MLDGVSTGGSTELLTEWIVVDKQLYRGVESWRIFGGND